MLRAFQPSPMFPEVPAQSGEALLRVRMVGFCGTDLNTFRGRNAMVEFPRVLGHEVAAEIISGGGDLADGSLVTVSPYTHCGVCAACLNARPNACQRKSDDGRSARRRHDELPQRSPREALHRQSFAGGTLSGGATDRGLSCRGARPCGSGGHRRGLRLRRHRSWGDCRIVLSRRPHDCHRYG